MKIAVINGSLSSPSKTYLTTSYVVDYLRAHFPEIQVSFIDLKDYNIVFCDARDPEEYEGDTKEVIDIIREADALLVGTPVYRGSIPGSLKNIFDIIPNDSLRGKVVGFIATGGTYHHFLAIEHQLKPLAGYFKAHVVPGNVYAHNEHFQNKQLTDDVIKERLKELADSLIDLARSINKKASGPEHPLIPRKSLSQS
ncbi:MsuE subfamily FMN reductase [Gracilibacillus halotolerans]|uniref:MsuE subfamily FMN reductase n=1 Tax=Gracilibacillus halotolerans TaxID=74386 RepID=A0A841RPD1_9BACI|nr:NADPH-dependent FMN reductase [Gracilibacillus halotolerans]MBB6514389.1 MsuE subfamily FMN reductase [Gracilibacillus halotolerans]